MIQDRYQRIKQTLNQALSPSHFELNDDSHQHGNGTRRESHYSATLVSTAFAGLTRVRRHQQVMRLLSDELSNGLHAFSAKLLTPEEWQASTQPHQVPPCVKAKVLQSDQG